MAHYPPDDARKIASTIMCMIKLNNSLKRTDPSERLSRTGSSPEQALVERDATLRNSETECPAFAGKLDGTAARPVPARILKSGLAVEPVTGRTFIDSLLEHAGEPVLLRGWVHRLRVLGKTTFLILRDCSGLAQCVAAGVINNYNNKYGNQATPAGQVLIANNLMTLSQLQKLGGVAPIISTPPPGQVDFTWLRAMDLKIAWQHTFKERFSIQPSVGFYNVGNFANFNLPPNTMNGLLNGVGSGSINGTDKTGNNQFRVGNGTGVYSLGSERQLEFGLQFNF